MGKRVEPVLVSYSSSGKPRARKSSSECIQPSLPSMRTFNHKSASPSMATRMTSLMGSLGAGREIRTLTLGPSDGDPCRQ